jgi:recombination protein RecA
VTKNVRKIAAARSVDAVVAQVQKSFGQAAAAKGGTQRALRSIPTGSLALDYELGTGGWPLGYLCGVFGRRDIGKSSMVGFNAVRNAQAMGLNCAWIAVEPVGGENWEGWAEKNGVNVDELAIFHPETGEDAFEILHMLVKSEAIDLVIFDSIGAVLGEGEMKEDGKPRQGGQAGLISWGVKRVAPIAFHNEVCVLLFNQVRHDMRPGVKGVVYKQPGGEALEHSEAVIVQLRNGKNRYTVRDAGVDVLVGQEIVADIKRNKLAEGTGRRAVFDYFFMETDDYPFGIDQTADVINTAVRTGVIERAGSYYRLPDGTSLQGLAKARDHFAANPDALASVRELVLAAIGSRNANPKVVAAAEEEAAPPNDASGV